MIDRPNVRVTRLAPSPTGALHLGNAQTFLANWALARQRGWRILLRIEDLDGPRVKGGADRQAIDDLTWLGLDWDDGPTWQRHDLAPYQAALARLRHHGLAYPCTCTRRDIERAQSAPHTDDHELRYPGTCRPKRSPPRYGGDTHEKELSVQASQRTSPTRGLLTDPHRVVVPDESIQFTDRLHGPVSMNVQRQVGDFLVATKAAVPSYQLAVVVDDARQSVTDVVRGDDLLSSTARQLWLYRMLNLADLPRYWHVPLVVGPDGRRLAKRHGDTRLAAYRRRGISSRRVVGLLARWSALTVDRVEMGVGEFVKRFDVAKLPRRAVTFTPDDETWLAKS